MNNAYKYSEPKTWERPNKPLKLPIDCTEKLSMLNFGDNYKRKIVGLL